MKDILIGNSSFENLIKGNYIYVDKTRYLYSLVKNSGAYYFLSRPRRFGKTLTVDTLEQIFKGRRELFKGLYIDSTDYAWKEYPVVHIDFGKCQKTTAVDFKGWLNRNIIKIGKSYNIELDMSLDYDDNLNTLIEELSEINSVVILIDEYDRMLSSNIYNPEIEAIRDVLKGFFEIIKASYANLRFVFITGVTKYAKVSIFSSMNNLFDISMDEPYGSMLGFTQCELESNFNEYIDKGCQSLGIKREVYLEKLKDKYDGYRFTPLSVETIYNPVSISSFFAKGGTNWDNYWAETGGTKLLRDIAKKVSYNIDSSLDEPLSKDDITYFDIVDIASQSVSLVEFESLLLQSGYLTIRRTEDNGYTLFLDYPNGEVRSSFAKMILSVYVGEEAQRSLNAVRLRNAFEERNTAKAISIISSYFASLSYILTSRSVEADYHLMLHAMLLAADADINTEVVTNKGRIDAVLTTKNTIYVIEIKQDKSAEEAINQIKDKGYMEKYMSWRLDKPGREIHLIGINFSSEAKNINDWREEILLDNEDNVPIGKGM